MKDFKVTLVIWLKQWLGQFIVQCIQQLHFYIVQPTAIVVMVNIFTRASFYRKIS
jgi:hypothetical protein